MVHACFHYFLKVQNTQQLVDAKRREVEAEEHQKQLAERDEGRYRSELERLNREGKDLQSRVWILFSTKISLIFIAKRDQR